MAEQPTINGETSVGSKIREMETNYISGRGTTVSKYVVKDMYEDICKIEAYLNSKHITGETDSQGREKPFFNIVVACANIWYRATMIKLSKIRVRATKSKDTIDAFLATVKIQDWMKRERFGAFITEWGRVLSRYGSSALEFIERGGRLIPTVLQWNRLIVDQVDFDNNPKIKILELTEAQLRQNTAYDQKMVDALCTAIANRRTLDKRNVDNKSDYIRLYEIHGELPLSELTKKDSDKNEYVQQIHTLSFVEGKRRGRKTEYEDFTLYSGREKNPHMITHLIKEDGQTLSIGAVQHLFEAQWMMNHTAKTIKDQLDLASKLIFQTSDGTFVSQNALSAIETGDILIHAKNEPLTKVDNNAHDITALQNYGAMWKSLSNEIGGISESMLGQTAPSGTAWRQIEALLKESQSLFDVMKDNKAISIEDMFRIYIIPHIKKKLDTSEEISATLEENDIQKIDAKYLKTEPVKRTNAKLKKRLIEGKTTTPEEQQTMLDEETNILRDSLSQMGNVRFFKPSDIPTKTWKKQLKDLEWELEVDSHDDDEVNEMLTTLNTLLMFFVKKQGQPLTENESMIVNKILNLTGQVSPLELKEEKPIPSQIQPAVAQPAT